MKKVRIMSFLWILLLTLQVGLKTEVWGLETIPATGDRTQIWIWVVLLALSGIVALILLIILLKNRKKDKDLREYLEQRNERPDLLEHSERHDPKA